MQLLTHVLTVLAANGWEKMRKLLLAMMLYMHLLQSLLCPSTMLLLTVVLLRMSGMQWLTKLNVI